MVNDLKSNPAGTVVRSQRVGVPQTTMFPWGTNSEHDEIRAAIAKVSDPECEV